MQPKRIGNLGEIKLVDILQEAITGCGIGVSCYRIAEIDSDLAIMVIVGPAACQVAEQWASERDICDGQVRAAIKRKDDREGHPS